MLVGPRTTSRSTSDVSSRSKASSKRPPIEFKDVNVRRGTRACDVLRNVGAIWQDCKGSAETYDLSVPVPGLDIFISHNWSTHRLRKFMTLALHFNFARAVWVGVVASGVAAALVVTGCLPLMHHWGAYTYCAPYVTVAAYIFPNATLLLGHEIVCRLGFWKARDKSVFLDKTCIHQTDKALQCKGLENLAAFLNASEEILVVYNDLYLRRLWTVYELVSVIVIKQAPHIRVRTAHFAFVVFLWWAGFFISSLLYTLMYSKEMQESIRKGHTVDLILLGGLSPVFLMLLCHLRGWAQKRKRMFSAVQNFNIHSAECTVDEDRRTVYRNISILMHDFGFVPPGASLDDALDCFNALARDLIPPHLDASFGMTGIPFRYIVLMASPVVAGGIDAVAANAGTQPSARWFLAETVWYIAEGCIVIPVWLAVGCWATSFGLQLKRRSEVLFMSFLWPVMILAYWSLRQFTTWLYNVGVASWAGLVADAATLGLGAVCVYLIYRPRRVHAHEREQWKEQRISDREALPRISDRGADEEEVVKPERTS